MDEDRKKWESQTELERDLRFQLAERDSKIKELDNQLHSWQASCESERVRAWTKEVVIQSKDATIESKNVLLAQKDSEIQHLKDMNEIQSRLLERYQTHISLSLEASKNKLLSLPIGKETEPG